jgi:hypothetical protein
MPKEFDEFEKVRHLVLDIIGFTVNKFLEWESATYERGYHHGYVSGECRTLKEKRTNSISSYREDPIPELQSGDSTSVAKKGSRGRPKKPSVFD